MQKLVMVLLVLGFLVINSSSVFAERFSKDKLSATAAQQSATMVTPEAVTKANVSDVEKTIARKKAELNATEWKIELKAIGGKGSGESDVIIFSDDKVASENLQKEGFAPTNFTVSLQGDGTVTWETMQTSQKSGTVFWRGDIQNGVMHGVLSKRDTKNNVSDFNFVSTGTSNSGASTKATVVSK